MKKTLSAGLALLLPLLCGISPANAQNLNLGTLPLYLGASVQPIVMLNLPRDHQLFIKAYNDYTDLDNDGIADTQYKHSIVYFGYFDAHKCYDYETTNHRFFPINPQRVATAIDRYCSNTGEQSTKWSGNFLNWVSMSRMDVVRKMLYGGLRIVDDNTQTVVERAIIPGDVHAWAKYYDGGGSANDIKRLTPFNLSSTPGTYASPAVTRTITSITRGNTVATVTSTGHGFVNNQTVVIAGVTGVDANLYNGTFTVAGVTANTFTYTMTGTPGANAPAGTLTATRGFPVLAVSTITFVQATATVTTTGAHNLKTGTVIKMSGARPEIYNGQYTIVSVPTASTFTYTVASTPTATSTTGSVTLASAVILLTNSGLTRNILGGDQIQLSANYTPTPTGVVTPDSATAGGVTVTGTATTVSDTQITVTVDGSSGGCSASVAPCTNGVPTSYVVSNLSSHGITICNLTMSNTATGTQAMAYNNNANPPLMRVMAGNYALWSTTDGRECRWANSESGGTNGNRGFFSEIAANQNSPTQQTVGQGTGLSGPTSATSTGQFVVRVKVCDAAVLGNEKCLQYPNGNWKPVGLLQDYASGNNRKIKFGLFTGSYSKNFSGGVLRKNASFLDTAVPPAPAAATDEIDPNTGVFRDVNGILKTLNNIKIYGYDFSTGNYSSGSDGCNSPGMVRFGSPLGGATFVEGNCSSWGNPLSEVFSETLRYLAGKSANTSFTPTPPAAGAYSSGGLTKDGTLSLNVQGWQDPVTAANYCAPLNVVVFNGSVNSYDRDQVESELANKDTGFGISTKAKTQAVGTAESIRNASPFSSYMIGDKGNSAIAPNGPGGTCTPKLFDQTYRLGDVFGICPEAPALEGSYLIAGAAHWAHTNKIRADFSPTAPPPTDTRSLKVNTYAVSLSGANPTIKIPVPGSFPTKYITILPAGRTLNAGSYRGTGSITEFKIVRQHIANGTGKFFVSWEDSLQGNDYDLDTWGYISYRFLPGNTQIEVTTQVVYASAGYTLGFGFVIGGTQGQDGVHYLSAHKGNTTFNFTAADGTVECSDCQVSNLARARTFTVATTAGATIFEEPLFLAAKYGGFTDQNGNSLPDQTTEFDSRKLDGSDGPDGLPDNYFLVTNPSSLEAAMDRAFIYILQVSSASSVATNSTSLNTGSRVYQARFNSSEWSGQLLSFSIDVNGSIDPTPQWDASQVLPAADSRVIITYNPGATPGTAAATKGVPFRWGSLTSAGLTSAAQIASLNLNGASTPSADAPGMLCTAHNTPVGCTVRGALRLNYLRGDQSNEGATATRLRVRPTTVLADVVNSTPKYVGPPAASYTDSGYLTFRSTYAARTPMLFVGSNGGMFHAFDATTGANAGIERLAYVPNKMYPNLTKLTNKDYNGTLHRYYVDGTPTIADACFAPCAKGADWRTVAVGGYNSGGQGYYALNVTDPTSWTEANAGNIVMWEFTDVNDPDLGFSYSKPLIVKMSNGRWAAVFGNGYNNSILTTDETACTGGLGTAALPYLPAGCSVSRTGKAYLYVVFLDGATDGVWTQGTDYIKIPTSAGSVGSPNGLASPLSVDTNGDGSVDYVYAGDLVGNMWKFDLTSANPASWNVASSGLPLFTATDSNSLGQAITTAPTVYMTTGGGLIVLFGTGKYLESIDDSTFTRGNSFYGVLDLLDNTTVAKSSLMRQKVLNVSANNKTGALIVGANTVRLSSAYVPNYISTPRNNAVGTYGDSDKLPNAVDEIAQTPADQRGWYIDMPNSGDNTFPSNVSPGTGERIVFDPLITTGKIIYSTLVPSTVACESGGTSFIMDMDPLTGSRLAFSPFDLNGDTNFTTADFVTYGGVSFAVSGIGSTIGIVPQPTVISASTGKEIKVLSGSSGGLTSILENAPSSSTASPSRTARRISWREVLSD
ncbi:MAG: hypothetical protein EXR28_01080 [Betaproteobacteria bacterium]|nr:hypothetical protein [Betaproteobacteria bacterium]